MPTDLPHNLKHFIYGKHFVMQDDRGYCVCDQINCSDELLHDHIDRYASLAEAINACVAAEKRHNEIR